jgi:hypothetical protein
VYALRERFLAETSRSATAVCAPCVPSRRMLQGTSAGR